MVKMKAPIPSNATTEDDFKLIEQKIKHPNIPIRSQYTDFSSAKKIGLFHQEPLKVPEEVKKTKQSDFIPIEIEEEKV